MAEESARQCDRCRGWTYDTVCPCSPDRPLDPVERLRALAARGVEITDEMRREAMGNATPPR